MALENGQFPTFSAPRPPERPRVSRARPSRKLTAAMDGSHKRAAAAINLNSPSLRRLLPPTGSGRPGEAASPRGRGFRGGGGGYALPLPVCKHGQGNTQACACVRGGRARPSRVHGCDSEFFRGVVDAGMGGRRALRGEKYTHAHAGVLSIPSKHPRLTQPWHCGLPPGSHWHQCNQKWPLAQHRSIE